MLSFKEPVVLLGGGDCASSILTALLQRNFRLVAADGGANHLDDLSIVPDVIIGDLDSLHNRSRWEAVTRVIELEEQDTTDFEKCLYSIDAPLYLALGFSGKRLDHTLAALHVIAKYSVSKRIYLVAEDDIVVVCRGAQSMHLRKGLRFSIFPLEPVSYLTSTGLKYPLDGLSLSPTTMIGTSNEVTQNRVRINTEQKSDGAYAVIVPISAMDKMLEWK